MTCADLRLLEQIEHIGILAIPDAVFHVPPVLTVAPVAGRRVPADVRPRAQSGGRRSDRDCDSAQCSRQRYNCSA